MHDHGTAVGFSSHDHSECMADGIARVEAACRKRGLQFTPARRRVLEIMLAEHRALGAYEILDQLRQEGMGSQPPVVYRALDFLVSNGFAHKIEALNAFMACAHPDEVHTPAFLVCRECSAVAETDSAKARSHLTERARSMGFALERTVVEALGLCPACQDNGVSA